MASSEQRSRLSWWPKHELPARDFPLRYLPITLILNTVIAIVIAILGSGWSDLPRGLVISHSIGLTILGLTSLSYRFLALRFGFGHGVQLLLYAVIIPVGAILGGALGRWLTGRGPVLEQFKDLNWTTALVFAFIGGSVVLIYGIATSVLDERQRRAERAERAAVEAQLRALQAQIEPHFLFNTLANLDVLIAVDAARAREMLGHLIRYLRAALTHSRSSSATLRNEIELLQSYLAIMALRLADRLQVEFSCDEHCMRLSFPPMLLQPLVENAVTHGIEPAREGGTIRIVATCSSETLLLQVQDTGVGLGQSPHAGTGAGIDSVRNRLASLYGEKASLQLEALAPRGTSARIAIPLALLKPAEA